MSERLKSPASQITVFGLALMTELMARIRFSERARSLFVGLKIPMIIRGCWFAREILVAAILQGEGISSGSAIRSSLTAMMTPPYPSGLSFRAGGVC